MPRIKYKEAAGIVSKKGRPAIGRMPSKADLKKLYIDELNSIRQVSKILGCSKDMVHRALQEYKIDRRKVSKTKESKLGKYSVSKLENMVNKNGYRDASKKLGVGSSTLYFYLKRRK